MKVSDVLAEMDEFTALAGDEDRDRVLEHWRVHCATISALSGIKAILDERGDTSLEFDMDSPALMTQALKKLEMVK